MGTLNVGTMDDKLADMMECRRQCGRRPGAPEADSNLGVEETWSRKKSDGIISLKLEIRVDVECSHCVRPAGWMSGGKEWTGRVREGGDWSILGQTCRRIKHRL